LTRTVEIGTWLGWNGQNLKHGIETKLTAETEHGNIAASNKSKTQILIFLRQGLFLYPDLSFLSKIIEAEKIRLCKFKHTNSYAEAFIKDVLYIHLSLFANELKIGKMTI